jgi:hypothetical protein
VRATTPVHRPRKSPALDPVPLAKTNIVDEGEAVRAEDLYGVIPAA